MVVGGPPSGRRSLLAQGPSAAAGVLSESPHPATPAGPRLPSVLVRVGTESGLAPTGREAACMAGNGTWVYPVFCVVAVWALSACVILWAPHATVG